MERYTLSHSHVLVEIDMVVYTVRGYLLDATAREGGLELVLAADDRLTRITVPASFRLYLVPQGVGSYEVASGLQSDEVEARIEEWYAPPWYDRISRIVVLESRSPSILWRIARKLESLGIARRVNTYPGMLVEALWRTGLTPGILVEISSNRFRPLEDPSDPLYPEPEIRIAHVEAYAWHGPVERSEYVERVEVECCGLSERLGSLEEACGVIDELKPHIVSARTPVQMRLPCRGDWLWFDPASNHVSVMGLIEWMRVSSLPYSEAHGAPIGKVLTAAEAREAYRRKYLLDPDAPRVERPRTALNLLEADIAGAARIPEAGVYWEVYQLDYHSLYPTLISLYNLSSETVDRPGCTRSIPVPGVDHYVCMDRRGLVAEVLGRLVERRGTVKRAKASMPWLEERDKALKWILVSGFGYLGFRNSLFGSIAAYESVTAHARRALSIAEREAERSGYRVIHAIVDSVFLQPVHPSISIEELMERIQRSSRVAVKLEASYRWLYISPTLQGSGAGNKYYGALKGGGVKVKGVSCIRRDTPPLIARAQCGSIRLLSRASSMEEFETLARSAAKSWARIIEALANGVVDPRHLKIRRKDRIYVMTRRGPWPVWLGKPANYNVEYYLRVAWWALRELPPTIRDNLSQIISARMIAGVSRL